jgi:hypothetical protein
MHYDIENYTVKIVLFKVNKLLGENKYYLGRLKN